MYLPYRSSCVSVRGDEVCCCITSESERCNPATYVLKHCAIEGSEAYFEIDAPSGAYQQLCHFHIACAGGKHLRVGGDNIREAQWRL